ncbi:UNC93-like protein 2 [Golovinomyces cichoracearum]|uniref:UNC93-like protein 2 n=1 Tax=Golovinomyces cichoracearum TaxID=62708 RepID=A0A420H868_9PEZI|nr:UNC93-like protein 2 [Golovinomyces cichoracearum]
MLPYQPDASRFKHFYRGVFAQMILLGALSFVGPALADAITNLGGGGLSSPYLANLVNSFQYISGCLMTLFGGPVINKMGIKKSCVVAAMGMPLVGSSYYSYARYGIIWYLVVAQMIGGLTGGFLYVAEATAMLSYPQPEDRGFYLGIWSAMRNSGSIFGGVINFAKNYNNSTTGGKSFPSLFLHFDLWLYHAQREPVLSKDGLKPKLLTSRRPYPECTGLVWALNLTPTRLVLRRNGHRIRMSPLRSWTQEFVALRLLAQQKKTWVLFIPAFYSFYHGGTLSSYLSLHFSIRSRALTSFIAPCVTVPSVVAYGRYLLDLDQWSQQRRAKIAVLIWIVPQMISFIWIGFENRRIDNGIQILDYDQNLGEWTFAVLPFIILFISGCLTQLSLYWIIGILSENISATSQLGGLFRAFEMAGQATSYALNAQKGNGVKISFYFNCFLWLFTVPCMIQLVQMVPHGPSSRYEITDSDEEIELN